MNQLSIKSKPYRFLVLFLLLLIASSLTAQHTLALDKQGKVKRLHFFEGDVIKVKLISNERIAGEIDGIYDSSFVIQGRKILMSEVSVVYTSRKAMQYTGTVSMAAGAFYLTIDMINNLFNYQARQYVVSNSVWAPAFIAMGTGAIVYYFSIRRSKVLGKGNFKIYDTTPIPIEGLAPPSCDNGVMAVLKKLRLDGCNWVLELPDSTKLEPVNIYDFVSNEDLDSGMDLSVKFTFATVKSASICMIGPMVEVTCLEIIK